MFGKKKRSNPIKVTKLSSLIAGNVEVHGDVHFTGGLRIDGKVFGNVLNREGETGLLVVSADGCIEGQVRAYDAVVNGSIKGDMRVDHFLELQPSARVQGNINYQQLQMDCGAAVHGHLVAMGEDAQPAADEDNVVPIAQAGERSAG